MSSLPCSSAPFPLPDNAKRPTFLPSTYQLSFEDDFNQAPGSVPDASKWDTALPWGPDLIINNEEQYYVDVLNGDTRADNPFIFDGNSNLIIRAQPLTTAQQSDTGQTYSSGVLTGFTNSSYKYGYQEARLKLPEDNIGLWAAFWLLNRYYSPAPAATGPNGKRETEIDWEMLRGTGGAFGGGPYDTNSAPLAYHYDNGSWTIDGNGFDGPGGEPGASQQCDGTPLWPGSGLSYASLPSGQDLALDFHNYGIWWTQDFIRWYLDGVEVGSICDPNIVSQIEMYPILNQAVGGNFPGDADPDTYQGGADMIVDYVCIYQDPTFQLAHTAVTQQPEDKPNCRWHRPNGSRLYVPQYY